MTPDPQEVGARLTKHLETWLGAWPAIGELTIASSPSRDHPGWDGAVHPVTGVRSPDGLVLSVPSPLVDAARAAAPDLDAVVAVLGEGLHYRGARLFEGVFRWSTQPAELPDAGEWLEVDDPIVPEWLRPFGGQVLVALQDGHYIAGVGIKHHDRYGQELAVVTEEGHREHGLARRLVAQAARRVIAGGAVPTYLHADSNVASARVADAAGFPDVGWRIVGLGHG